MQSVSNSKSSKITIEGVSLLFFSLIIFSYNFHVIWLIYDLLAIGAIYFFIKNTNFIILLYTSLAFLFFIALILKDNIHAISFLSIWDNGKHLFVLFMLLKLLDRYANTNRIRSFIMKFSIFFPIVFCIQVSLVLYQYFSGYFFDDISGTFGYRGSHSIGYFCLLYIVYLMFVRRSTYYLIFIVVVSLFLNYLSDNIGFYVLFLFLLIFRLYRQYNFSMIIVYGLTLLLAFYGLNLLLGGNMIGEIIYRVTRLINVANVDTSIIVDSRPFLMFYAYSVGGLFGAGPGAYSEIYQMNGWLIPTLFDNKLNLNISACTSLIAEYGVSGFILWISIYLKYLCYFFSDLSSKLFVSFLFVSCVFYNNILNDERIIFMFIFIVLFLKIYTKQNLKSTSA
jgi:hypothetical protein